MCTDTVCIMKVKQNKYMGRGSDSVVKYVLCLISSGGEVTINGSLDYETAQQHLLNITVSDSVLNSTDTLTVNVNDENEEPIFGNLPATVNVSEHIAMTTSVFNASATDPERDALTYSLAQNGTLFAIDMTSK